MIKSLSLKLFLSVAVIATCNFLTYAQTEVTPISYSGVEQVEDISANELFARAQTWLAQSYNNGKHVLQMADNNRLVGKAIIPFIYDCGGMYGKAQCRIEYTLTIECRDGRYKYTIDNIKLFVHPQPGKRRLDGSPSEEQYWGLLTTAESIPRMNSWKALMPDKHRQKLWQGAKKDMDMYAKLLAVSLQESMILQTSNNDW